MIENIKNNDNYTKRLIPFYVISIILHLIFLGMTFAYSSIANASNEFKTTVYEGGNDTGIDKESGTPMDDNKEASVKRKKIFRVDYFNTLLLEKPIKVKPIIKPKPVPEIPKPVKPHPIQPPESDQIPIETNLDIENVEKTGIILTFEELQKEGIVLQFPPYIFDIIPYNDQNWQSFRSLACSGHDIIYFLADISKKDGFEEYFKWAAFWDFLFSMDAVKDPPTPIGIAEIIEDPYFLTPQMASDALRMRIETMEYNVPTYKNFNFLDINGQILAPLDIEELELPIVFLVDHQGYVRLKLEGRIEDIPLDHVKKAVGVIKKMWNMNDIESALAIAAIISYQQKLENEKKNDSDVN
ncbi:MAG: hypothetical protein ABIG42_06545 [bacterium]